MEGLLSTGPTPSSLCKSQLHPYEILGDVGGMGLEGVVELYVPIILQL